MPMLLMTRASKYMGVDARTVVIDFIRIHQSYLVNMKHIEKVSRYEALLNNGIKLEIPKARYKFVEETFVSYRGEL